MCSVLLYNENTGKQYFENKQESIIFDNELCRDIRKNIRKYKERIDELEQDILKKK